MSEWMGLHNPHRHNTNVIGGCRPCRHCEELAREAFTWCDSEEPCNCCLAAEVESLRARIERVRELLGDERHNPYPNTGSYDDGWNNCRRAALEALNGGDDE